MPDLPTVRNQVRIRLELTVAREIDEQRHAGGHQRLHVRGRDIGRKGAAILAGEQEAGKDGVMLGIGDLVMDFWAMA